MRVATSTIACLALAALHAGASEAPGTPAEAPTDAPAGFDDASNGLVDDETHAADREAFDEAETVDEGLGPIHNAQACRECHQSPVSGGVSQLTELRVGSLDRLGRFTNPVVPIGDGSAVVRGRSLVNDRAICPSAAFPDRGAHSRVPRDAEIRTLRASLNTLGDGFVEAIPNGALLRLAAAQCARSRGEICGQAVLVPVLEADGRLRVGRFGWKAQHASLLSFSADAYLNEMGITSALLPEEVTPVCDAVDDPEDEPGEDGLADVDRFARFMRASKAPPRVAALARRPDALAGEALFARIGCAECHVPSHVTAAPGTAINAGAFRVPEALGSKRIHPYSDFLLHDVGTGDGIVQNGGPQTAQKLRTPPLWGVRTRTRLMHDAASLDFESAIRRHRGEAASSSRAFRDLARSRQRELVAFLSSL
jgi:CxxC motif-containing protein (DUF1111 family)